MSRLTCRAARGAVRRVGALFGLALLGAAAPAAAEIDINLNNDSALVRYLAQDGPAGAFARREMDAGLIFTRDRDYLLMLGAQLIAEAGASLPELEAGVGFKAFGMRFDRDNMFALGVGGQLRYSAPPHRRLILGAQGYYAPDVVTSSPGKRMTYLDLTAGYEVVPDAVAYVGYRSVRAKRRDKGTGTMDSGMHFGVRFAF